MDNIAFTGHSRGGKTAALAVAGATVKALGARYVTPAQRALADDVPHKADVIRGVDFHGSPLVKHLCDLPLGNADAVLDRHFASVNLFECLTELRCFVFIHIDFHLQKRFNQKFTTGQNGVGVFLQINIATLASIVDDTYQ